MKAPTAHSVNTGMGSAVTMSDATFFAISVVVLAALLYWPVLRIIWALGVRHLEAKQDQALGEAQRRGQLRRARLLSAVVVVGFSVLFNLATVGVPANE